LENQLKEKGEEILKLKLPKIRFDVHINNKFQQVLKNLNKLSEERITGKESFDQNLTMYKMYKIRCLFIILLLISLVLGTGQFENNMHISS